MTEKVGLVKSVKPRTTLKDRLKKMVKPAVKTAVVALTAAAGYFAGINKSGNNNAVDFTQLQDHIGEITSATLKGTEGEVKYYSGKDIHNVIVKDKTGRTSMMGWNDKRAVFQDSDGNKMISEGEDFDWVFVDSLSAEDQALVGTLPAPTQISARRSGQEM